MVSGRGPGLEAQADANWTLETIANRSSEMPAPGGFQRDKWCVALGIQKVASSSVL